MNVLEVPIELAVLDSSIPDREDGLILDHLLQYCSRCDSLPAITLRVDGRRALVVRNHKYLEVARRLGRTKVRAVVEGSTSPSALATLLSQQGVQRLDWEEIKRREAADPVPTAWHVFFFHRALGNEEKSEFARIVARFYQSTTIIHSDERCLAEFACPTPVNDQDWARQLLQELTSFSRDRVRIVSYQGRRFPT